LLLIESFSLCLCIRRLGEFLKLALVLSLNGDVLVWRVICDSILRTAEI